jgi:hypothetical protein
MVLGFGACPKITLAGQFESRTLTGRSLGTVYNGPHPGAVGRGIDPRGTGGIPRSEAANVKMDFCASELADRSVEGTIMVRFS